ncbi:MAG: hypothetical protein ACQET5_13425 [Halobacteriota archaeon]|uniref:hypothetical protein n=1 Tax=Natronomonas sp. TaxID=2184060 RepID=UPI003975CD72
MLTRRHALVGLLGATFGGGALTAGAFSPSLTTGADLRVFVVSELTLTPERETDTYLEVDRAGEVTEIVLEKLNRRAISRFDELVRITNNGDVTFDELAFEFEVTDPDTGDRADAVEEALGITHNGTIIHDGSDGATILDGESDELAPGDHEIFGVAVDLTTLGDLPDTNLDVQLLLTAKRGDDT